MRIAFVGKGGSGKSVASWLFSNYIAENEGYVCAIDGDHNMDLTALFGVDFNDTTQTFHRFHEKFRNVVGQKEDKAWHNIVLDDRKLPTFSLKPSIDTFSESLRVPVQDNIDLMLVGLGAEDVLYSTRCAHGHSAPLKYYLPLLDARDVHVVVDGVAGADMLNAGVYNGVDVICIIVEPQPNSIRVCTQIKTIAEKLNIPTAVIVNKATNNKFLEEIENIFQGFILGNLPIDAAIINADYSLVSETTKNILKEIWENMKERFSYGDALLRVKKFEMLRLNVVTPVQ